MNEKLRLAGLFTISLLASACSPRAPEAPPLEGASIGGTFTLTNQDGGRTSDRDFAGRYRLIYFGYTYCPDVCPVDLQQLAQGLRRFEKQDPARGAKVQPIFITVDPARDTPNVLKQYVAAFHPRLIGLTGSPEQIKDVAKRYGIFFAKHEVEGSSDYLMDHSRMAVLFGPDGKPIAIIPHDQGAEAVAAELQRWVA